MAKLPKKRKGKESGFSPVEEGSYFARITKSELKSTKDNKKNKGIVLTVKIMKGENKGKTITPWFNVKHTNQESEKIGLEQLDGVAYACGIDEYNDTKEFHGIDIGIDVSIDGKYNRIDRYYPVEESKGKKGKKKNKKKDW